MPDSPEEGSKIREWKKRLKERGFGRRLLIAILLVLSLALFLHFREVRIEMLEIDSLAKNYIVAQVDFEFPDEEGTVILSQEAVRDIGPIYKLDSKEIDKRRYEFEEYLINKPDWRNELPRSTFEEMYNSGDAIKKKLLLERLTDPRTIDRMRSLKLATDNYLSQENLNVEEEVTLPDEFWEKVQEELSKRKNFHPDAIAFTINYFQQFSWGILSDIPDQRALRKAVEATVPEKLTRIQAGSRIIDKGQEVSGRHLAMLQAMKNALAEKRNLWQPLTLLGSLLFATVIIVLSSVYFHTFFKKFALSLRKLSLYATIIILTLIFAKVIEYFLISDTNNLMDTARYPLIVPFAAILICVLIGNEVAFFTTCFLAILLGLSLAVDHSRFIVANIIGGIVTILSAKTLRKRKEVFIVCGKVWLSVIPIFFVYNFARNQLWNFALISDLTSTFVFMLLSAILVVGLLPILESIFHIMTDITLMEYMDPNNELLRRLSIEAPGTYQHSLVVGSLSEAAAQVIGANGLFCRVSTMYHDIGKLFNPHYFTENQMGGFNIHQLLTPLESTQVIIAHVLEGEALARKYGLPQSFIDVIREHHGTTLVYFFYAKQVEQMGGDVEAVDESHFRYPGPKPRSKESAIIMIADTIEAASRSLDEVSEESITELVDRLVQDKAEEGQFDECQLTFEELGLVKKKIVKTLVVTRHLRVKYPQRKY